MKLKYKLLMVGSDCELFVRDLSGKPIPAIGLIGGTKEKPRPILDGKGYAVQEDNVMVEFNIPPAKQAAQFVADINKVLGYLSAYLHEKDLMTLDFSASQEFQKEQLDHPQAQHIGCEPDYCVWTRSMNEIDRDNPIFQFLRTSGAHVHTTYTVNSHRPKPEQVEAFVKTQDLFKGVPSVLLDKDTKRKLFYGKAGAFRFKKYGHDAGHEYRVLSNFWLQTDALKKWVFTQTQRCVHELNSGILPMVEKAGSRIVECINNNDKKLAVRLCNEFQIAIPA